MIKNVKMVIDQSHQYQPLNLRDITRQPRVNAGFYFCPYIPKMYLHGREPEPNINKEIGRRNA